MGIWTEAACGTSALLCRCSASVPSGRSTSSASAGDPAPADHRTLQQFENVTAAEWIRRTQGERVWRTVWGPLFYQKFADRASRSRWSGCGASSGCAGRSRSESGMGERLGYMRGSFARMVTALEDRITPPAGVPAQRAGPSIERADGPLPGGHARRWRSPRTKVVVAAPCRTTSRSQATSSPRASSAACRACRPLCDLHRARDEPFADSVLLAQHRRIRDAVRRPHRAHQLHPRERYGGRHILYISNYLFPDHPLYRATKDDVLRSYLPALRRVNPPSTGRGSWPTTTCAPTTPSPWSRSATASRSRPCGARCPGSICAAWPRSSPRTAG